MHQQSRRKALSALASVLVPVYALKTNMSLGKELTTNHAEGMFEVTIKPQPAGSPEAEAAGLSRMSIDKYFHGPLEAHSTGEMLSITTAVKGSAGYVALERVTGTLHDRTGSFVLQHNGMMNRGVPQLEVAVVPDSATGQLAGLSGTMTIRIEAGQHFYDFTYTLAANR